MRETKETVNVYAMHLCTFTWLMNNEIYTLDNQYRFAPDVVALPEFAYPGHWTFAIPKIAHKLYFHVVSATINIINN